MPYCTIDDIKSKRIPEATLVQLTDDQNIEQVDEAVVTGIIADADELIDAHLRGRYALPLATVPGMVKALSVDLSVYNLYGRRSEFEIPKAVGDRHAAALKILVGIKKGDIQLGIAGVESPAAEEPADGMQATEPTRMFTSDVMDLY